MTENLTKEFFVSEKKPLFHAEGAKKGSDTNYVKTKRECGLQLAQLMESMSFNQYAAVLGQMPSSAAGCGKLRAEFGKSRENALLQTHFFHCRHGEHEIISSVRFVKDKCALIPIRAARSPCGFDYLVHR